MRQRRAGPGAGRRLIACALLILAGCSSHAPGAEMASASLHGDRLDASQVAAGERLLVRRAAVELEAGDPAAAAEEVEELVRRSDGYIAESTSGNRVELRLRVPAERLDAFLDQLEGVGEVKEKTVSSTDVTEESIDLEARLENLVAVRDRIRRHLDRASNVEEIIAVERELGRVQSEIDSLSGRLEFLRSSAAMADVYLRIRRERILGPLGLLVSGVGWVIRKLFVIR